MKRIPLSFITTAVLLSFFSSISSASAESKDPVSSTVHDKSGSTIMIGVSSVGGLAGDAADYLGADSKMLNFSYDYTFEKGFILGLSSTVMSDTDVRDNRGGYGTLSTGGASIYGGYQLDNNLRLKAGVGFVVADVDTTYYYGNDTAQGLLLGIGYAINNKIVLDLTHSFIDDAPMTNVSIGVKF